MIALAITCSAAWAADNGAAEAKRQAQTCADALVQHDYDTFASMLYPKLLQWTGGRNALIQKLQLSDQDMASKGITMQSVVMGEVTQIRRAKGDTFAVVPETIVMGTRDGILRTDAYLLGISSDDGKTWHFIDGAGIANMGKEIYILLPNLPADMPLTQPEQPALAPAKANPAVSRKAAAGGDAVAIDRTFYTAKLPKGSRIEPLTPNGNADLQTTVILPNGDTLTIVASDKVRLLPAAFDESVAASKAQLKQPSVSPSDLFKSRGGKGTIISGTVQGVSYTYEVGMFSSKNKAFVLICGYEQASPDETRQILRKVLDSFVAKD